MWTRQNLYDWAVRLKINTTLEGQYCKPGTVPVLGLHDVRFDSIYGMIMILFTFTLWECAVKLSHDAVEVVLAWCLRLLVGWHALRFVTTQPRRK